MKEAAEFAESTQILMNVSEFTDVSQATDTLISAVQAFGYTAETSMDVVDLLNTIGNNYAISTADLAKSLTKSSASLVAAGGNLAEAAALTATANAIIQDADSVGTALKTTSLRLRGTSVKVLEEEGLDSDGAVESTSKLRGQVLATSGVDILTDTGAYKSTYQILLEIAEVWDQITDDKARAGLLELLAGKRNSSVIAALLQNPEDLKAAYEDAMDAEGSALKENERYLDSIQGKIDQFNNAMQAMWSNALDSDIVKGFVELGTELIKIIDKIGLFNSALIALATYSMFKHKMGPITFFKELVTTIPKGIKSLQTWIQGMQASDAATIASIKTKVADTAATTANTAANTSNAASSVAAGVAEDKDTADTVENTAATVADTAATTANTAANTSNAASSVAAGANGAVVGAKGAATAGSATTAAGAGAAGASAFTGLAAAVPYILAAVAALAVIVTIFKASTKDISELKEELQESKSGLDNTKNEIKSINAELETTQKRIADLLAKPSLSFVEQEELEQLQQQNELLERNLNLQKMILAQQEAQVISDAEEYLSASWDGDRWYDKAYAVNGATGIISEDQWYTRGVSAKEALDVAIGKYADTKKTRDALSTLAMEWDENSSDGNAKLISDLDLDGLIYAGVDDKKYVLERQKGYDAALVEIASGISSVLDDPQYSGLSYGMSAEIDSFLDELNAYQYKFKEAQGVAGKSSAIASIFDDTSSDSIKKLKEDLSKIAGDDALDDAAKQKNALYLVNKAIDSTSGEYDRLKTSMDIIGIKADEVARYFVQLSESPDSSTIEGITAQYHKGVEALGKYKGAANDIIAEFTDLDGTVEQITWGSLFDNEGEAIDTQISKVLQGADETTRNEFARIAKSVNEGTMSIEQAMSSFSGSGLVAVSKLIEESFGELNKSVFKGLEDEISGFIDTFSEFSAALEDVASSMDLLHTAQEQYNNSGQVSVKTALELMQSTDQWNKILTVENGKITLNTEAQDILVQSKLSTVEANLAEAKASIQNQLAQLGAADATLLSAEASDITTEAYTIYTNAMNSYTASIAGFGAALDALVNGRIFGDDGIIGSFKSAYDATKEVKTYENTTNIAALREKLAEVNQMEDFFEGVDTFDEFASNYDFDKTPGDKYEDKKTKEEEIEDGWEKLLAKYENQLALLSNERDLIQAEIDRAEARGGKASEKYYEDLIRNSAEEKTLLIAKKKELEDYLRINRLNLDPETWTEYNNEINATAVAIKECEQNILEYADAIREIDMHYFEQTIEQISRLGEEIDFVMSLFDDEEMANEDGSWTDAGITKINLLRDQMTLYAATAQEYAEQIQELEKMYANGMTEGDYNYWADYFTKSYELGHMSEDAYTHRMSQLAQGLAAGTMSAEMYNEILNELVDGQQDAILSGKDARDGLIELNEARIDAIENGIEKEIEAYEDLINVQKEELDAARELHDFRKQVSNDSKDISELERRIASLSGSTAAADIAERRKLQAQLRDKQSELDDRYYDHAHDARSNALDEEAEAFTNSKERYLESIRQAAKDTEAVVNDMLLNGIFNADVANEFLNNIQNTYGVPLSKELTDPWDQAAKQAEKYKNSVGIITGTDIPPYVVKLSDKIISELGLGSEKNPWGNAVNAAKTYSDFLTGKEFTLPDSTLTTFGEEIQSIVGYWESVKKAANEAYSAQQRTMNVGGTTNGGVDSGDNDDGSRRNLMSQKKYYTTAELKIGGTTLLGLGEGLTKNYAEQEAKLDITGAYQTHQEMKGVSEEKYESAWQRTWRDRVTYNTMYYAKGTTGTTSDQWAITDEPRFGDELVLVPGKDGNLSFMRKGTGVVPADLTANLMEWGQFTPDALDIGSSVNVNMINNAVNKPEFNFAFDALVKAENITEETLPAVKKLVTQELNRFTKELNYALKGKGAR